MKSEILSWSTFLIICIGFTALGRPQVLQLDDGTKLTFLGATAGTRQMAVIPSLLTCGRLSPSPLHLCVRQEGACQLRGHLVLVKEVAGRILRRFSPGNQAAQKYLAAIGGERHHGHRGRV